MAAIQQAFRSATILCLSTAILFLSSTLLRAEIWGHWPLDDGDGEVARDLGPRGEDGDVGNYDFGGLGDDGNVWVVDDDRGTVASFNGFADGSWIFVGFMPDVLTNDVDFTWSFWARQDEDQASPANDIILGNRHAADGSDTVPREFVKFTANRFEYHMDAGVLLETNSDGTESFIDDMQYLDCDFCEERHIPSPSDWLHHTVVKRGPTLTYYRNGELWNTDEVETEQLSPEPLPIYFGGEDSTAEGEKWRGYISDVWLFDEALTDADVVCVMNGEGKCSGVLGDFNGDGLLSDLDINDLTLQSATLSNPPPYDLNADQLVNQGDVTVWIEDLFKSWVGDANLDGEFNSSDLVVVLAGGKYEIDAEAVWTTGDFNGDGRANSSDLVAALSGGGYEMGPRAAVAAVPEPGTITLVLLSLLSLAACIRSRSAA